MMGTGGKQLKFFISDIFTLVSAATKALSAGDTGLDHVIAAVPIRTTSAGVDSRLETTFSITGGSITLSTTGATTTNYYKIWAMGY